MEDMKIGIRDLGGAEGETGSLAAAVWRLQISPKCLNMSSSVS